MFAVSRLRFKGIMPRNRSLAADDDKFLYIYATFWYLLVKIGWQKRVFQTSNFTKSSLHLRPNFFQM